MHESGQNLFVKSQKASQLWGSRVSSNFSLSAALAYFKSRKGNSVKYLGPKPLKC